MFKPLTTLLVTICALSLLPIAVFADDEVLNPEPTAEKKADMGSGDPSSSVGNDPLSPTPSPEDPNAKRTLEGAEEDTGPANAAAPTGTSGDEPAAEGEAKSAAATDSDADTAARDEAIFERIKRLVKEFDATARKGSEFPDRNVEVAVRSEFLRRTEGKLEIYWAHKRRVRGADRQVALDNLEMFITYAENLRKLTAGQKKIKSKALAEYRMLAVKALIDRYNRDHGDTTLHLSPKHLTKFGKEELQRRRLLGGLQIGGEDYGPIGGRTMGSVIGNYKGFLDNASKEFGRFAVLLGGSRALASSSNAADAEPAAKTAGKGAKTAKKGAKGAQRKPASKGGKKKTKKK